MTPKQKYDERKRLRAERLLRQEQKAQGARQREDDVEEQMLRMMTAFERIADLMTMRRMASEFPTPWAEKMKERGIAA